MKKINFIILLFVLFGSSTLYAQQKPALSWKDVSKWRSIRSFTSTISPNGQWHAYSIGPTEGDLELVLRKTADTTTYHFPCGAAPTSLNFSNDSKYAAFKVSAKDAEQKAAKKTGKPLYDQMVLITPGNSTKTTFEKVRSFKFANDVPGWIAISFAPAENAGKDKDAAKGTDLLLYNADTKKSFNLGNVSEFAFNKSGDLLAYVVDANGQNGNGVMLRNMKTGMTTAIENDKANYKTLNWTEDGTAFTVLKSVKNDLYKNEVYSVLGIKKINGDLSEKTVYASLDDKTFPKNMGISGNSRPSWSEDQKTIFFGISALEKKDAKGKADSTKKADKADKKVDAKTDKDKAVPAKADSSAIAKTKAPEKVNKDDLEKPDMTIWNWKDRKLQSAQQVQEMSDKNSSYLSMYKVDEKKFVQLADSNMRSISVGGKQLYALGYDNSNYELNGNLDGQSYTDIYLINLNSGAKKKLFEKFYATGAGRVVIAPNGKLASYYQDGIFYSVNFETGQISNLTGSIKSSFVDALDDHNVRKPATDNFGWSSDSKYALIKDNYDLWRISADGRSVTPLSNNWKNKKIMVNNRFSIYEDEKGTDLSKTQYFAVFDDTNKKNGLGKLDAGKNNIQILWLDDNSYGNVNKATKANVFTYSKENNQQSPEIYMSNQADLGNARQISQNTPDQAKYAWSSGVKLINYVSANGDSLQAALYLPANYVEGKSYPTITYIYERLTQSLNSYTMPGFPGGGFNKAMYNSNGYAVLMPDIKYKLNDPGMSSVACVVPAVQAAIATGIVDAKRVAIHGHSWGGYQTAFLITQTNIFKAAAAGAPLTNMISMYSLIYWNSGGTNQAIFEASQGRLTPGYWDNWDAFSRNSPIYHIKKVQTPLLLLHNDKDGAVDFTQGVEYYNGLRRLNKPVVMITYKGENHGIAKLPNRKDYAVRMMEYFDYFLKDKTAPDWWENGVKRLDMEKHLENRVFEQQD